MVIEVKSLSIIGSGMADGHLTEESREILVSAEKVFSLCFENSWLLAILGQNSSIVNLTEAYAIGCRASDVYGEIAAAVVGDPEDWRQGVLVVEGNPQLFNTPVRRIVSAAEHNGWHVEVFPAISSIDTLMIDLDLIIEEQGLQIVDAARMLLWSIHLNASMGCLILQPAAHSSERFVRPEEQTPEMFATLKNWLLRYYNSNHPLTIVRSNGSGRRVAALENSTVEAFDLAAKKIDYSCSLYLPPDAGTRRFSDEFADELRNVPRP